MKTPRDVSGQEMVKALKNFGYKFVRQNGSHITVTTMENGEHHLAIPNHNPIKIGTFNGIIALVAQHFGLSKIRYWKSSFEILRCVLSQQLRSKVVPAHPHLPGRQRLPGPHRAGITSLLDSTATGPEKPPGVHAR